jgi:hypothetical protein
VGEPIHTSTPNPEAAADQRKKVGNAKGKAGKMEAKDKHTPEEKLTLDVLKSKIEE